MQLKCSKQLMSNWRQEKPLEVRVGAGEVKCVNEREEENRAEGRRQAAS